MPLRNNMKYLGDSVYAKYDGKELQLYLSNDGDVHNLIIMEPEVVKELLKYLDKGGD